MSHDIIIIIIIAPSTKECRHVAALYTSGSSIGRGPQAPPPLSFTKPAADGQRPRPCFFLLGMMRHVGALSYHKETTSRRKESIEGGGRRGGMVGWWVLLEPCGGFLFHVPSPRLEPTRLSLPLLAGEGEALAARLRERGGGSGKQKEGLLAEAKGAAGVWV